MPTPQSELYIETSKSSAESHPVPSVETKICSKCNLPLPVDDFYHVAKGSDRRLAYCKSCSKKSNKEYATNNYEKRNEAKRLWRVDNPEAVKTIKKRSYDKNHENRLRYTKEWREKNPEKSKRTNRDHNLKNKGVDADWYNRTLSEQKGRCALCGSTDPKGRGTVFSIDHDHACCPRNHACDKCRRGLLCTPCNVKLGHLENIEWIRQAKVYLRKYLIKDFSVPDQPSLFDCL